MTFSAYQRLRVITWASDREVIRAARGKLARRSFSLEYRDARKLYYRNMLEYHHRSQQLCKEFAL